jgi:hypothetical protein
LKKFFKTRLATIIITVLVVSLVSGVAVFATSYSKDLPSTGKIVSATPDLAFFSDVTCQTPVTNIAWGDIVQGDQKVVTIYVKNIGNKNMTAITYASSLTGDVGTMTYSTNQFLLNKGASQQLTITLNTFVTGTLGDISPVITFSGTY